MNWLALDIGGANLKLADGKGYADFRPFALWREPENLAHQLRTLISEAPPCDHLAATMTGELADCFATKSDGVRFILEALKEAADGRHTRIYLTDGAMVAPQMAMTNPELAAASNWHALAAFASRYVKQETGLLIDIGSTTCDLIPLADGRPVISGITDTARLLSGELVYTGVERSPVFGLADTVPYRGQACPMAQELFATSLDVYLILGDLPEQPENTHSADGRPATRQAARDRLARSVCADRQSFNDQDSRDVAVALAHSQQDRICRAARGVLDAQPLPLSTVVLSGQGEFLARRVADQFDFSPKCVSLTEELGPEISRCGPAHALAVLAREAAGP